MILFDEFQDSVKLGGEALVKRLRALLQETRHITCLFCGSQATLMDTLFTHRREPFYRFATPVQLPPIQPDDWNSYLRLKFESLGMSITDPALTILHARTDGHPYDVMAVAY